MRGTPAESKRVQNPTIKAAIMLDRAVKDYLNGRISANILAVVAQDYINTVGKGKEGAQLVLPE